MATKIKNKTATKGAKAGMGDGGSKPKPVSKPTGGTKSGDGKTAGGKRGC